MALNAAWHDAHVLGRGATLDERVAWHVEHARECGCRKMPESVKREIERRSRPREADR